MPLGNWLLVAPMLAPQETESGIALVDRPQCNDAMVLDVPDGRVMDNGERYPIGIEAGDRVIIAPQHLRSHLEPGEAFARIEDVVAVIPGPDHAQVRAMNQYALVAPELIKREEELPSGVILSHRRLRGGTSRDLERGERLLAEQKARGLKYLRMGLCEAERVDLQRKDLLDMPQVDRDALAEAYRMMVQEGNEDTGFKFMRPTSSATDPRRGTLVSLGPGRVLPDGKTERPVGLREGLRVHWEVTLPKKRGQAKPEPNRIVELWDGHRILFALDWQSLCAFELCGVAA